MVSVDLDLVDKLDADAIEERLNELPTDIEASWPEAIPIDLAFGNAVRVEVPGNRRQLARSYRVIRRLVADPTIREELRRVFRLVGVGRPYPRGASQEVIGAWIEGDEARREAIRQEAARFAAAHSYADISSASVVALFVRVLGGLRRREDGTIPCSMRVTSLHDLPVAYVNPLPDIELHAPVPPGHIVVDLTNATHADLDLITETIARLQRRLGYRWRDGGRPRDDRAQRCHEFRLRLPDAIARARRAHCKPTPQPLSMWEIAEGFGWHEDTLSARCRECGVDPRGLKRRAGARIATN